MKNLFEHTSAPWIRYSGYEYKADDNGGFYITVSKGAKPEMYRPMQETGQLIINALNIGLAAMHKVPEEELKESVLDFVKKYGFLGFMAALPTTVDFITYESVYLPKNHFIKEESLIGISNAMGELCYPIDHSIAGGTEDVKTAAISFFVTPAFFAFSGWYCPL